MEYRVTIKGAPYGDPHELLDTFESDSDAGAIARAERLAAEHRQPGQTVQLWDEASLQRPDGPIWST